MPWFVNGAEKNMHTIAFGPFTTEKRAIKVATGLSTALSYVSSPYELEAEDVEALEVIVARYRWMISSPDDAVEGAGFEAMKKSEAGRLFMVAIEAEEKKRPSPQGDFDDPPTEKTPAP